MFSRNIFRELSKSKFILASLGIISLSGILGGGLLLINPSTAKASTSIPPEKGGVLNINSNGLVTSFLNHDYDYPSSKVAQIDDKNSPDKNTVFLAVDHDKAKNDPYCKNIDLNLNTCLKSQIDSQYLDNKSHTLIISLWKIGGEKIVLFTKTFTLSFICNKDVKNLDNQYATVAAVSTLKQKNQLSCDGVARYYPNFFYIPRLDSKYEISASLQRYLILRDKNTGGVYSYNDSVAGPEQVSDIKPDLGWKIETAAYSTGDNPEELIFWRNYSTGESVVWSTIAGELKNWKYIKLSDGKTDVLDLNWHIVGTDDVNNDGVVDIIWRNYKTGENVVWFMNPSNPNDKVTTLKSATSLSEEYKSVSTEWSFVGLNRLYYSSYDPQNLGLYIFWQNTSTGEITYWKVSQHHNDKLLHYDSGLSLGILENKNLRVKGASDISELGINDFSISFVVQ